MSMSNHLYDSLSDIVDDIEGDNESVSQLDTEVLHFPITVAIGSEEYLYQLPEDIKTLKFTMENTIRVIVKEFDDKMELRATTDLTNIEFIYIKSTTKFISLSAYKYEDAKESQLTQQVQITIESISDETLEEIVTKQPEFIGELNGESIVNYANYRKGWYKSWGGGYEYQANMECSRNRYLVNPNYVYYFNTNDSRFCVSIQQYDENGNWIKLYGELKNGSTFKAYNEKVKYITTRAYTSVWGVGIESMMGHGLWVNFSLENKEFKTEMIEESKFPLSNVTSWQTGEYAYSTGQYALNEKTVCSTKYIILSNNKTRRVRTWDTYVKCYILEFDKDGNKLIGGEYNNGITWTPQENTYYISITLTNTNSMLSEQVLDKIRNSEVKPSIDIRVKYNYNTKMKNISADEYVKIINVGWNLGNSFDSYYGEWGGEHRSLETVWGNPTVAKELIDFVADQGFNSMRLPVSWYLNTYLDENGNYKVYEYWIDRVQDILDYAIQRGLYVMMNTHFDSKFLTLAQEDEQMEKEYKYAKDIWTEIANYFKNYDEHLIFESYNELATKTNAWTYTTIGNDQMTKLNQIFVDAVRATGGNNTNRVLCVQTLTSMYDANTLGNFVLPKDTVPNKLVVQIHNYSEAVDQSVEPFFTSIETFSKKVGAPVVVGEYAINNGGEKLEYKRYKVSNYVARAAMHGVKVFYWDDGNAKHFYLVNRRNLPCSDFESIKAIINPKPYATKYVQFLTKFDDFYYMTMNQSTGELMEDKYWGSITTKNTAPLPEDAELVTVTLGTVTCTDLYKAHYIAFFDENKNLVQIKNSNVGYSNTILIIPQEARYIRVGINSSFTATNESVYAKYFACSEMGFSVSYVSKSSLYEDPNNTGKVLKLEPNDGGDFFNNFNAIDYNLFDSWVMGYYPWGKIMKESKTGMAINQFLRIEKGKTLTYKSSSSAVRCTINEYNSILKTLNGKTLCNNQSLTLSEDTVYISIAISAPYQSETWTEELYRLWFSRGSHITFE